MRLTQSAHIISCAFAYAVIQGCVVPVKLHPQEILAAGTNSTTTDNTRFKWKWKSTISGGQEGCVP